MVKSTAKGLNLSFQQHAEVILRDKNVQEEQTIDERHQALLAECFLECLH